MMIMLDNIKYFANNSETLKEVRIDVKEMSTIKEVGIFIGLFVVLRLLEPIFVPLHVI